MAKYMPVEFFEDVYREKIKKEIEEGREINALLLVQGYIESYLFDLIICRVSINNSPNVIKKIVNEIEKRRLGLKDLSLINLMIGSIDIKIFKKIIDLTKKRNKIVHELISIDVSNPKEKKKIKNTVKFGLEICEELSKIHEKLIRELEKKLK